MRVVHLPVYEENAYQRLLMDAQRQLGIETINGGGGGNFFRTALKRWKADILHFHWLHPYLVRTTTLGTLLRSARLIFELTVLRLSGQRIVWTVHNLKNHDNRHTRLERWFTKLFVGLASAVITHSPHARTEAAAVFGISDSNRIHVVPHGNYIGCYPNTVSSREARDELGLAQDSFVFLFLGRIHPYKGIGELLDAFSRLGRQASLLIAGKPVNDNAAAAVKERIGRNNRIAYFPDYVPSERLQYFFNACDVVVLPFREILTSGSAVLAMSFRRPCVAPRIGSLPETFPADGAFLYDPANESGLLGAMREALDRRTELAAMGNRNLERAREWSWESVAAKTVQIYSAVLGDRSMEDRRGRRPLNR